MSNNYTMSDEGLNVTRKAEGTVYHLYNDPTGNCSCGTGHLVHLGPCCGAASEEPFKNGVSFAQETALLRHDIAYAEHVVNHLVTVPLTQHEFDALVDFVFNVGSGTFQKSTLLAKLNSGDYTDIPAELKRYNRSCGKVLPGLDVRRATEAAEFQEA